jgi:uncharacterized protein (DUF1697 family)
MTTRIAFLRAVNLGRRRVPMATLVQITGALGYEDAWTHVNSGNVVFDAHGSRGDIERTFEEALEAEFGFEVTTFVRTAAELRTALDLHPFEVGAGDTYFVTFLKEPPSAAGRRELEGLGDDFDTLVVKGADVHWLMHGRSTDTTIPARHWERFVGKHRSTSRNTTMLTKLLARIDART